MSHGTTRAGYRGCQKFVEPEESVELAESLRYQQRERYVEKAAEDDLPEGRAGR
jgi:hypothetical protein